MSSKFTKIISYIIPPLITVGLCYVLYSDIDSGNVFARLGDWNFALMALFLALNVVAMLLRALRWRLQLRAIGVSPSFADMVRAIFGCYGLNILLPRLGELWRSAYIARGAKKPFSEVFGSMIADRVSDTIVVGLIGLSSFGIASSAMLAFARKSTAFAGLGSMLTSWVALIALIAVVAVALFVIFAKNRFAARIRGFIAKTWTGFAVVFKMPGRTRWLFLTAGIWVSYIASMYVSMLAFAPTAQLLADHGFACALLTFVFGSLSMAVPSNGGIGPWQIAVMMSLCGIYGMTQEPALSFATINLAMTTLLTVVLGIWTFISIALKKR